jgi:bifunctional UDP-N-acetylglucosamine pyrophosphorylase/glucosamine-1-phosphate N-acetyltransferase
MLVAPREIGPGAYVAAGSAVTEDVPAGAIAIGRARQRNILGWVLRRRAGTKSADAARTAGAEGTMEPPSPPRSPSTDHPQQGSQP